MSGLAPLFEHPADQLVDRLSGYYCTSCDPEPQPKETHDNMTTTTYEGPVLDTKQRSSLGDFRERPIACQRRCSRSTFNIGGVCNGCTPCVHTRLDVDDPDRCDGTAAVWFEGTMPLCELCRRESRALYRSPWVITHDPAHGFMLTDRAGRSIDVGPADAKRVVECRQMLEAVVIVRALVSGPPVVVNMTTGELVVLS